MKEELDPETIKDLWDVLARASDRDPDGGIVGVAHMVSTRF
jgi:hypothetical protein